MIRFLDIRRNSAQYASELEESIKRVAQSGWYLRGAETKSFEENYSKYIGTNNTIGCASGLDALWLIFRAYIEMGLFSQGDEIIVPANTFIATIMAITENGLKPILVEPDIDTLQIDIERIETLITARTKAICIVHLYGRCSYDESLENLCKIYSLKLIEDNAQAHGCRYGARRTGSLGDAAAHSFYPGKVLGAMGDAGAVTTHSAGLAETVRSLSNYGMNRRYYNRYVGRNSRMDEIQAAVLNVKLKYIEQEIAGRKRVADIYRQAIQNCEVLIPSGLYTADNVFHLFPILSKSRNELQTYMWEQGIETQIHYPIPPHRQECYSERFNTPLPITEQIAESELSLPIYSTLYDEEVSRIIECINSYKKRI